MIFGFTVRAAEAQRRGLFRLFPSILVLQLLTRLLQKTTLSSESTLSIFPIQLHCQTMPPTADPGSKVPLFDMGYQ